VFLEARRGEKDRCPSKALLPWRENGLSLASLAQYETRGP